VKPVLQALVLAEHVYEDKSGKKIIAGTFNSVHFCKKLPVAELESPDGTKRRGMLGDMHAGAPYAYISMTDLCDSTVLTLQFVNLSKNEVLFSAELVAQGEDRLGTTEIVAPLPPLPIKEAGTYAFEVLCEGEILGSHRILASELSLPNQD